MNKMRLIEIFYSMQGEGPAMGRPATFVRLADCNLRCEGCDTDQKPVRILTLSALLEEIKTSGTESGHHGRRAHVADGRAIGVDHWAAEHGQGDSYRDKRHQSHSRRDPGKNLLCSGEPQTRIEFSSRLLGRKGERPPKICIGKGRMVLDIRTIGRSWSPIWIRKESG